MIRRRRACTIRFWVSKTETARIFCDSGFFLNVMLNKEKIDALEIPTSSGCYQFLNGSGKIIYVGKAVNLKSRVRSYFQVSAEHSPAKQRMIAEAAKVKWLEVDTEIEALLLEANLIKKYQPDYNVLLRDDKRFAYLQISLDDEVPGLFVTRNLGKSGKYYGPFTSSRALTETLKALRKIWPYCTQRKIKNQPCFYYQIKRCSGVCGGIISREEYMKRVIKPIIDFLDGKKMKLLREYEQQIKLLEKKRPEPASEEYQALIKARLTLSHFKHVLDSTKVISVGEKYANDVLELAKVLKLSKVPYRIEGYDISNTFGQQVVGSMVVFVSGEAEKSSYKKFKIKTEKEGDVWSLAEMLTRRLEHQEWPVPELILIDGGKAQVNQAQRILKKFKLEIEVLGLSKGAGLRSAIARDKIYFAGEKLPLELPLASPALHLLKRVRDEAHRFAITYHRDLRAKKFIVK